MSEIIYLQWNREHLRVMTVAEELSRRTVRLTAQTGFIDHADPAVPAQDAGLRLRAWLDECRIPKGKCTVVLPRELVVMRRLSVPQAPDDELPDLVRFQAATKTSSPIDALMLDYLTLSTPDADGGRQVVTLTIDRTLLERITRVLAGAELQLEHLRMAPLTIAQLVKAQGAADLGEASPDLMIFQDGRDIELSILADGTLVFSHFLQLPEEASEDRLKPLQNELTRSLVALGQMSHGLAVERCFYVGGQSDAGVMELLRKKYPRGFQQVSVTGALKGNDAHGYEALVGAALPHLDSRLQLDFLHPRRKVEKADRRKLYWGIGGGVAAVALLTGYMLYRSSLSTLEVSIDDLNTQIAAIDNKLNAGKQQQVDYDLLAKWKEGDSDPIELWNNLKKLLPGTDRLYFSDLRFDAQTGDKVAKFIGKGRAKSRLDVESMTQALSQNGYNVVPSAPQNSPGDPAYPVQFSFHVELLRPAEPAPASAAPAPVPPASTAAVIPSPAAG